MRSANYYIKHYAIIMPDVTFDVEVDDHLRRIVVLARAFDSFLFAELITRVIPTTSESSRFTTTTTPRELASCTQSCCDSTTSSSPPD